MSQHDETYGKINTVFVKYIENHVPCVNGKTAPLAKKRVPKHAAEAADPVAGVLKHTAPLASPAALATPDPTALDAIRAITERPKTPNSPRIKDPAKKAQAQAMLAEMKAKVADSDARTNAALGLAPEPLASNPGEPGDGDVDPPDDAAIGYADEVALIASYTDPLNYRAARDGLAKRTGRALTDIDTAVAAKRRALVLATWPEPDMTVIARPEGELPSCPTTAFGHLKTWVEQTAEGAGAPLDYVALATLTGAAGLIGARRWVRAWDGFEQPAILWGAVVGEPGHNKSPALAPVRKALTLAEEALNWDWKSRKRQYDDALALAIAAKKGWEAAVAKAVANGKPEPLFPDSARKPDPVHRYRRMIEDATMERLKGILAEPENQGGLLSFHDELASWIGGQDRYVAGGKGGDRAGWLTAYNGDSATVDRKVEGGSVAIPAFAVSLIGGIQPEKLEKAVLSGVNDGLASRFLYVMPAPVPPKTPDHVPPVETLAAAFKRLANLSYPEQRIIIPLQQEAKAAFEAWHHGTHNAALKAAHGAMKHIMDKHRGGVLRIALTLEYLWWAADPMAGPEPRAVSERAMGYALMLIDEWLIHHAARVFAETSRPAEDSQAATLAKWIVKAKPETINAYAVRIKEKLPGIRDSKGMKVACEGLVSAGWLRFAGGRDGENQGRQRLDFQVNPWILENPKARE